VSRSARTCTLAAVLLVVGAAAVSGLRTTPARAAAASGSGEEVFAQNCSACHQLTGKGIPGAFPALAGDSFVQGTPDKVALTLLNGRGGMPSFRNDLSDAQIAAVISYVRSAWGNQAPPIDAALVAHLRGHGGPEDPGAALQAH
jgi:cytochrome c6